MDIKTLTEKDIGKWVIYTPTFGDKELGRIKSYNNIFIFVVYNCNKEWDRFQDYTGCATRPEDLKEA
jgi:hypothetical protein